MNFNIILTYSITLEDLDIFRSARHLIGKWDVDMLLDSNLPLVNRKPISKYDEFDFLLSSLFKQCTTKILSVTAYMSLKLAIQV